MRTDYIYCFVKNECLHRRGCKRWIGNYSEEEVKELYSKCRFVSEVDYEDCIMEDMDYDNVKYPFDMLDRFRLSDGTEIKK